MIHSWILTTRISQMRKGSICYIFFEWNLTLPRSSYHLLVQINLKLQLVFSIYCPLHHLFLWSQCPFSVLKFLLTSSLVFLRMMGTNYIGPFCLTKLLLPLLKRSPVPSRIVNVTSFTHRSGEYLQVLQIYTYITDLYMCMYIYSLGWR